MCDSKFTPSTFTRIGAFPMLVTQEDDACTASRRTSASCLIPFVCLGPKWQEWDCGDLGTESCDAQWRADEQSVRSDVHSHSNVCVSHSSMSLPALGTDHPENVTVLVGVGVTCRSMCIFLITSDAEFISICLSCSTCWGVSDLGFAMWGSGGLAL